MNLRPEIAKLMAEKTPNIKPVFAVKGDRKGQHVEKTYRYKFPSSPERHIAIVRKATETGITVYINNISVSGSEYIISEIDGIRISEKYDKGHEGKNGNKGISSSVSRLSSLNPKVNDVLRLSISNESAFQNLLEWYFNIEPLSINSQVNGIKISNEANFDEKLTNESGNYIDEDNEILGYQIDPKKRKCIELYAEDLAVEYYKELGFTVEKKGKPFDLLCTRDNLTIHVEAKGTTGMANKVILTRNEVTDARNNNWQSDLFVVHGITLLEVEGIWKASGGAKLLFEKWMPEEKDLLPINYEYSISKNQ